MPDYQIRAGDQLPPIEATLVDAAGAPINLTGSTVQLLYRPIAGGATISRACTIVDALAGSVKYQWAAGETSTPGTYLAYFSLTAPDGRTETFPNTRYLRLVFGPV